jgi:hypothetical protein
MRCAIILWIEGTGRKPLSLPDRHRLTQRRYRAKTRTEEPMSTFSLGNPPPPLYNHGAILPHIEEGERFLKTTNVRAVLTDSHFWVPALVLAVGIVLLVVLH